MVARIFSRIGRTFGGDTAMYSSMFVGAGWLTLIAPPILALASNSPSGPKDVCTQVAQARVDNDSGYSRVWSKTLCQTQGGDDVGTAGDPTKHTFFPGQSPSHRFCLCGRNGLDFVDLIRLPQRRHETNAD